MRAMTVLRSLVLLLALGALGLCGACGWWGWRSHAANRDFERLLAGDEDTALVAVEFHGHEQRVPLTDAASLGYLSAMIRSCERGSTEAGGNIYSMTARLSTGRSVRCAVDVLERKDGLSLHFPIDEVGDGISYTITLREPIPEALARVLSQLRSE